METKICSKCNRGLPLDCFNKSKSRKDGLDPYCKTCKNEQSKQVYLKRKDAKLAKAKEYRNSTGYDKLYYQANKDKKKEYQNNKYPPLTSRKKGVKRDVEDTKKVRRTTFTINKQMCVNYKGGKCFSCGYNKCLAALEFHHINPNEKEFNIGTKLKRLDSFDDIKSELDKCILLCSNCHRELHNDNNIIGR